MLSKKDQGGMGKYEWRNPNLQLALILFFWEFIMIVYYFMLIIN
jgi:hypothetical protein